MNCPGEIALFFGMLLPAIVLGQNFETIKKQEIIESRIDFLLESNESGDNDYTSLFERLEFYYKKPLNLNSASRLELIDLGLLNEIQINKLLKHIHVNGKLMGLEELQSIESFDRETIELIQPFVKTNGHVDQLRISPKNLLKEGASSLFLRYSRILEKQAGFRSLSPEEQASSPNSAYLGSPYKLYSRYRFNYGNKLSLGITAEKDAGEEFFQNSQSQGFDFYSAHFFMQEFGSIKQLAIGDYQAQFGQGLTFWSGLAFGRSSNVFSIKRNAAGLRPYTSVQEDLFLRGAGITLNKNHFDLTLFHSSTKVDATVIGTDSSKQELIVSSLGQSGFHRTTSELEKKNTIRNSFTGANLSFNKQNLGLGLTAIHNEIDARYIPNLSLYNKFSSIDNKNTNIGFDYSYLLNNINFFGEISKSIDGGIAFTNGALLVLDPSLSLSIQHRDFDRNFIAIQSNAIGENSGNSNEKGVFMGMNARLGKSIMLSAFVDRFEFEWLRFQRDAPSSGKQYLLEVNYSSSKRLSAYVRFRQKSRSKNKTEEGSRLNELHNEHLKKLRFHLNYQVSQTIQLKNRIEFSRYTFGARESENGILIYQDLRYKRLNSPFSLSVRYAIFDSDGYNSRIYAYENDVLYSFSIPAYSGRGTRFYFSSKYHLTRQIDLWLRYSQFYYSDREAIGNAKDEIIGRTKSELKAQIRLKF